VKEFIKKLRRHADRFFTNAKSDYEAGEYDVAMFNLEQSAQLYLKAKILSYGIQFPKTHSVGELMRKLSQIGIENIGDLLQNNRRIIESLEIAYISSRYLPLSFTREDAEEGIRFVEKLRERHWGTRQYS